MQRSLNLNSFVNAMKMLTVQYIWHFIASLVVFALMLALFSQYDVSSVRFTVFQGGGLVFLFLLVVNAYLIGDDHLQKGRKGSAWFFFALGFMMLIMMDFITAPYVIQALLL